MVATGNASGTNDNQEPHDLPEDQEETEAGTNERDESAASIQDDDQTSPTADGVGAGSDEAEIAEDDEPASDAASTDDTSVPQEDDTPPENNEGWRLEIKAHSWEFSVDRAASFYVASNGKPEDVQGTPVKLSIERMGERNFWEPFRSFNLELGKGGYSEQNTVRFNQPGSYRATATAEGYPGASRKFEVAASQKRDPFFEIHLGKDGTVSVQARDFPNPERYIAMARLARLPFRKLIDETVVETAFDAHGRAKMQFDTKVLHGGEYVAQLVVLDDQNKAVKALWSKETIRVEKPRVTPSYEQFESPRPDTASERTRNFEPPFEPPQGSEPKQTPMTVDPCVNLLGEGISLVVQGFLCAASKNASTAAVGEAKSDQPTPVPSSDTRKEVQSAAGDDTKVVPGSKPTQQEEPQPPKETVSAVQEPLPVVVPASVPEDRRAPRSWRHNDRLLTWAGLLLLTLIICWGMGGDSTGSRLVLKLLATATALVGLPFALGRQTGPTLAAGLAGVIIAVTSLIMGVGHETSARLEQKQVEEAKIAAEQRVLEEKRLSETWEDHPASGAAFAPDGSLSVIMVDGSLEVIPAGQIYVRQDLGKRNTTKILVCENGLGQKRFVGVTVRCVGRDVSLGEISAHNARPRLREKPAGAHSAPEYKDQLREMLIDNIPMDSVAGWEDVCPIIDTGTIPTADDELGGTTLNLKRWVGDTSP